MTISKVLVGVLVPAAMLLAVGCTGEVDDNAGPLSWDAFASMAYQEPDTGVYIVNGDEIVENDVQLREAYDRYLDTYYSVSGEVSRLRETLIVNTVSGKDDKWSDAQAQNLTYCVSKKGFGANYNAVVTAMEAASGAWEATARVNFIHDASQDSNCTNRNNAVMFDVNTVCRGQYLARSFFPSTARRSRNVLIDCTSFGTIDPWTLAGVLRHELGHTIGFRHEHTRPEAGTCFEDNQWRALTAYDSSSVMHYPQCNGTQNGDLVLTNLDKAGASSLYP
jgi:hypothetical protein